MVKADSTQAGDIGSNPSAGRKKMVGFLLMVNDNGD